MCIRDRIMTILSLGEPCPRSGAPSSHGSRYRVYFDRFLSKHFNLSSVSFKRKSKEKKQMSSRQSVWKETSRFVHPSCLLHPSRDWQTEGEFSSFRESSVCNPMSIQMQSISGACAIQMQSNVNPMSIHSIRHHRVRRPAEYLELKRKYLMSNTQRT